MSTVHSYPPTPPAAPIGITSPTPQNVKARLEEVPTPSIATQNRASRPQATKISQFLSTPYVTAPQPGLDRTSFITRALSIFSSNRPSQTASFTLTPFNPSPNPNPLS